MRAPETFEVALVVLFGFVVLGILVAWFVR